MEFRILGPLEVIHDGSPIALRAAKQRAIVTLLALYSPKPLSSDRLITELWGERAPPTAEHAIQVYVSAIRKALRGVAGSDGILRTNSGGYVLNVDPNEIDARRFERLVDEAQRIAAQDPNRSRGLLEHALALWRGEVLDGLEYAGDAKLEAGQLEELRVVATES